MKGGRTAAITAAALASLASACASGGGSAGTAGAAAPIVDPPAPPPADPPPPSDFEDAEYNRDYSLALIGASQAYSLGGTGEGVTIAVIDTGLDFTHREFHNQLNPNIVDIIGTRNNYGDGQYHGTAVAGVIAAARDGAGMHGVAYDAQLLAIRADSDTVGGCPENCLFLSSDLAAAIDYAIAQDVDIINLSLGGSADPDPILDAAVLRAVEAGILVVAAAGNDGADVPDNPANLAGTENALGRVVAVGAVDENGELSDFSNLAGGAGGYFILAPGEGLTSTIPLDSDPICADSPTCYAEGLAGTSFAAPHVAGALALVLDAFPYLEPEQALEVLLLTATDIGDAGVDTETGAGVLNLAQAFQAYGATSISLGTVQGGEVSTVVTFAPPSGAFGDWASTSGAFDGVIVRDAFDRGFSFTPSAAEARGDALGAFEGAAAAQRLDARAARTPFGSAAFRAPEDAALPLANLTTDADLAGDMRVSAELGALSLAAGRGLAAPALRGASGAVLADPGAGVASLASGGDWSAIGYQLGAWRLSARAVRSQTGASVSAAGIERQFGAFSAGLEAGAAREPDAALGSAVLGRLGGSDDASSSFAALSWSGPAPLGWSLGGRVELARAALDAPDYVEITESAAASAWRLGAERAFDGGVLALTLAQPLRAETGAVRFDAPVAVTRSGATLYETRDAAITPSGREVSFESAVRLRLDDGAWTTLAARVTSEPGHVASADPEGALWLGLRMTR